MLSSLKIRIPHPITPRAYNMQHHYELRPNHIKLTPTGSGFFYLALLSVMLVSSLNYQNNLGILTSLFFFLCLLISGFHTRKLLLELTLNINKIEPVFCNSPAHVIISIAKTGNMNNAILHLNTDLSADRTVCLGAEKKQTLTYAIPTRQRGEHIIRQINLSTCYPLNVIKAKTAIDCELHFIVYPDPAFAEHQNPSYAPHQLHHLQNVNQTDYAGMRAYTPGDPFKLINWKTAARTENLYVNIYSAATHNDAWIDWDDYSGLNTEQRLSLMTRAVIEHEKDQSNYGLQLPGKRLRPNFGLLHMKQCLTALACYSDSYSHTARPQPS